MYHTNPKVTMHILVIHNTYSFTTIRISEMNNIHVHVLHEPKVTMHIIHCECLFSPSILMLPMVLVVFIIVTMPFHVQSTSLDITSWPSLIMGLQGTLKHA